MSDVEYSMAALTGGLSAKLAVSGTSAASPVIGGSYVVVTPDTNVFFRRGSTPVALADGTDQILLANQSYRLYGLNTQDKLAFITSGATGNVYLSPGA